MFRGFERRILRMIYGVIHDNGIWRVGHSNEPYTLYEPDIDKVVKMGRLKWLGNHCRMQELNPCRMLTVLKPEGTRGIGKPKWS
jgi:hypothetical protein